jgi:hypothetical protein
LVAIDGASWSPVATLFAVCQVGVATAALAFVAVKTAEDATTARAMSFFISRPSQTA